jgi:L-fucose mutarotase
LLKGISTLISPDLLRTLHEMGHGDELLLADAHFPGHRFGNRILRADGLGITPLLDAIMPLLELDLAVNPLSMMLADGSDVLDPTVEADYLQAIRRSMPAAYQKAQACFAIVMTGELRPYGNIFLRKGVTMSG